MISGMHGVLFTRNVISSSDVLIFRRDGMISIRDGMISVGD
jgi:hypothetical protein